MHMTARPTDWDVQTEFIPLLQSHNLTDAQIHATVLPRRTIGAIQTVRAAICDWHQSDNFASTALNKACRAYLAQQSRSRYTCRNHLNITF